METWTCDNTNLADCTRYLSANLGYQIYHMGDHKVEWASYYNLENSNAYFGLWYDGELRGWTTWEFHNTVFGRFDANNTDETDDGSDTDDSYDNGDGEIIDWSDNESDYFYDNTFMDGKGKKLRNTIEILDSWQLEQTLTWTEGDIYNWFTSEIIYTGEYYAHRFGFNGDILADFNMQNNTSHGMMGTQIQQEFDDPNGAGFLYMEWVDFNYEYVQYSVQKTNCQADCNVYSFYFKLDGEIFCDTWFSYDQSCWDLNNSGWNPSEEETRTSRVWLLGEPDMSPREATSSATTALGVTAALGVAISLGIYARKRYVAGRSDTDQFVRA